jgi:hypothetical protein
MPFINTRAIAGTPLGFYDKTRSEFACRRQAPFQFNFALHAACKRALNSNALCMRQANILLLVHKTSTVFNFHYFFTPHSKM